MSTIVSLNYTPRLWQREVHAAFRAGARFVVTATHRRGGKTKAALMQLLDAALKATSIAPLFAYLAPFRTQAKAIAWTELKATVAHLGPLAVDISESELAVTLKHNGARIVLFGADNATALRGLRLDGVVLDEFAFIAPDVWHAVIQPALADRSGWALFIGTPAGIDAFSELFFAAADKPGWQSLRFTVHDTGALPRAEVDRLKRDMPDQAFAREFLCDFSASGDDQLISLGDCEAAAHRRYAGRDIAGSPKILGVDPARFGDDRSVIMRRQGLQAFEPLVLRGVDNMQLAARVANVIADWRPDAVFIDSGAGAGVIDRLRQLGFTVIEVPFGGRASKPDLFTNRRGEMWATMAEWLRSGGAIPNDAGLKLELATPRYSFDATGRRVLESKDEIRKRISSGSPDIADALALTFALPVASHARRPVDLSGFQFQDLGLDELSGARHFAYLTLRRERPLLHDYDPYADLR
jgi:hypothetical protein